MRASHVLVPSEPFDMNRHLSRGGMRVPACRDSSFEHQWLGTGQRQSVSARQWSMLEVISIALSIRPKCFESVELYPHACSDCRSRTSMWLDGARGTKAYRCSRVQSFCARGDVTSGDTEKCTWQRQTHMEYSIRATCKVDTQAGAEIREDSPVSATRNRQAIPVRKGGAGKLREGTGRAHKSRKSKEGWRAVVGPEFDGTLGFPGEGPCKQNLLTVSSANVTAWSKLCFGV